MVGGKDDEWRRLRCLPGWEETWEGAEERAGGKLQCPNGAGQQGKGDGVMRGVLFLGTAVSKRARPIITKPSVDTVVVIANPDREVGLRNRTRCTR